jgi:hypothetical protein
MTRSGLMNTGHTRLIKSLSTPCGKKYDGSEKKIAMLFKLHKKVCPSCSKVDAPNKIVHKTFQTNFTQTKSKLIDVHFSEARKNN